MLINELFEQANNNGVIDDNQNNKPLTKAVIGFYKPIIDKIQPEPVDDYVNKARTLLNKSDDPSIRNKMLEIFKKGKKDPGLQGGIITAIAAILTGGLLTASSRMGLTPAQTNILLQAVLNTVIPTIIARINNKSWMDTIKYTLASAVVGTGVAASLGEEQLDELSFLGSQCTKDCSGHKAGYHWFKQKQHDPNSWSPSFNKGAALAKAGK